MYSVEKILTDIVALLPEANFSNGNTAVIQFGWGSQLDLNKHLLAKGKLRKYPLIWLVQNKETEDVRKRRITKRLKIIIAINSEKLTNLNPLIWETDFEITLNPIANNFIKAINNNGKSKLTDGIVSREKLPNYSEKINSASNVDANKTKAIDVWNAILLECEVEFNDNTCFQNIIFNN